MIIPDALRLGWMRSSSLHRALSDSGRASRMAEFEMKVER